MNPIKKINLKPRFLEKILEKKQTTLQKFFNIEELPNPVDIRKVYWDIDELHKKINDAQKSCDLDILSEIKDNITSIRSCASDFYIDAELLEKEISNLNFAYESLCSLLIEIINKENIDLRNYSSNLTDEEWKSLKRQSKISNIVDE